ncbi:MAG: AmmeMemoRadiSam system protein A, partial [Candidatus Wallbacteria bacterium]|nr:AmmeMemoRadiSam system protein A [Candidatus Wallbacteria bacterium]
LILLFVWPRTIYCSESQNLEKKEIKKMSGFSISEKNQQELLKLARSSISCYLDQRQYMKYETSDPELTAPGAVFVTLTSGGNLRGCIGTTEARGPLWEAVLQLACAAAFQDSRFRPLSATELKHVHIEISVLSPMMRVGSHEEIQQNTHGVMVKRGRSSGLFLPQVWEHFDKREDFLSELCSQKAGLPRDAYKMPDTELYVFTVFPFEEP